MVVRKYNLSHPNSLLFTGSILILIGCTLHIIHLYQQINWDVLCCFPIHTCYQIDCCCCCRIATAADDDIAAAAAAT